MRTPTGTRPDRRRPLRPPSVAGRGPHPAPPEPPVGTAGRGFALLCASVAAGLVANSVCGPLVLDLIDYPFAATIENQLIGLELVSVFLVVPLCLAAGVLALRGHPAAGPLAFGPAAYTAYMLVQYVLGPEYAAYVPAAVLQLVLFVLSLVLAVWAWSRSVGLGAEIPASRRRVYGLALLALAVFVLSRYASGLAGASTHTPIPAEFAASRTFYWSIFLLDLGVVVPGTVAAAVSVLRGGHLAAASLYAVVGWFALVPPSVASMGIVMLARDDPYASVPQVLVLSTVAVLFAAFAVVVFRPLFAREAATG